MRQLTTDLDQGDARPYFLWDEDLSVAELGAKLHGADQVERRRLLAKLLREARDTDVWHFVSPDEVAAELPAISFMLGRRREFWRFLIDGWRADGIFDESVVVDLVLERVVQVSPEKQEIEGIRLDPPEEILANKLTALASRAEIRDLVDVMMMEQAGYDLAKALEGALAKDGGCTPATLAWVLSQIEIPDGTDLPGGVDAAELREYLEDLIRRLRSAAAP